VLELARDGDVERTEPLAVGNEPVRKKIG